jgi:hypothetical protein
LKAPRCVAVVALASVALVLLASSCSSSPTDASPVPLDRDFDLRVTESVRLDATDLVIHFDAVLNDSRCPVDVQCVTAGDATVRMTVREGDGASAPLELHTTEEPKQGAHGAFVVRLVELRPLPRASRPILASEYVATLRVGRR